MTLPIKFWRVAYEESIKIKNDGKDITITLDKDGRFVLPPTPKPYTITVTDIAGNVTGPISIVIN